MWLADLTEEQKKKLRMLGIDPEALAAEQAAEPADDAEVDEQPERLERLAKLKEAGALTDAEFEAQKKRILES